MGRLARWFDETLLPPTKRCQRRKLYLDWADEGEIGVQAVLVEGTSMDNVREHHYSVDCEQDGSVVYFAKQSPKREQTLASLGCDDYLSDESEVYAVTDLSPGRRPRCTCPGNTAGGSTCKHIQIAIHMIEKRIFTRLPLICKQRKRFERYAKIG
jgi:hypothetical protein